MPLTLRPLLPGDEAQARAAQDELHADGFDFLFGLTDGMAWPEYLELREKSAAGIDVPDHLVPDTFLGAFVDDTLIGRLSLRHELNDYLRLAGGHIGYAVRPAHRRRGHATAVLRAGLALARDKGIDPVLLTCNDDNLASAAVILACGGEFGGIVTDPVTHRAKRRYWIRVT